MSATSQADLETLKAERAEATDEKTYAALSAQIENAERQLSIMAAQRRKAEREKAERARAEALKAHKEKLAQIEKLRAEVGKNDATIFKALDVYSRAIDDQYRDGLALAKLTESAAKSAQELGEPPVSVELVRFFGLLYQSKIPVQIAREIMERYYLLVGYLIDARNNGLPAPDKVDPAWMETGGRLVVEPNGEIRFV